jgi:hypothetical protein
MVGKPLHYNGSVQHTANAENEATGNEPLEMTDEMRKNLGSNPYEIDLSE